jgi:hypothetical protein
VPRYMFNVFDGMDLPDDEGMLLAGLPQARSMALRLAGDLIRDSETFWERNEWRLEVTDETGLVLFTLALFAVHAAV